MDIQPVKNCKYACSKSATWQSGFTLMANFHQKFRLTVYVVFSYFLFVPDLCEETIYHTVALNKCTSHQIQNINNVIISLIATIQRNNWRHLLNRMPVLHQHNIFTDSECFKQQLRLYGYAKSHVCHRLPITDWQPWQIYTRSFD